MIPVDIRVVCTGIGISTSIGLGKSAFWQGIMDTKCGVKLLTRLNEKNYSHKHAYEIEASFDKENEIGRASAMALYTVHEAIMDARVQDKEKMSLVVGTGLGDFREVENSLNNGFINCESISTNVSGIMALTGPALTISTGCAASNYAIGYAYDQIKNGYIEFAVAGGSDSLSSVMYGVFDRVNMAVPTICQPFDAKRKGVVVGEGAAFLVLESLESAKRRNAYIYGEILGYGLSCDAYHATAPDQLGMERAMSKALNNANVIPKEIDFIAMHGTGTILNDITETRAVKEVFGTHSYTLATSSNKAMVGHTGGASGAVSMVSSFLSMNYKMIPPTINLTNHDDQCDLDYTPNTPRRMNVHKAMVNSFGFGGNNCCIVVGSV